MGSADTITAEQIRKLRDAAQRRLDLGDFGHGDEDTVVACDRAMRVDYGHDDEDRDALYETARARCAEILNARKAQP